MKGKRLVSQCGPVGGFRPTMGSWNAETGRACGTTLARTAWPGYTRKDGPMTAREVEDAQDFGEIHGYAAICGHAELQDDASGSSVIAKAFGKVSRNAA